MKKAISVLLAAILALGLGAPAAAEQAEETLAAQSSVNWDDFYIVAQPEDMTVNYGEDLVFSVEVNVPDGVEVTYQWYANSLYLLSDANGPIFTCSSNHSFYPRLYRTSGFMNPLYEEGWWYYYCKIVGEEKDDGGNILSSKELISDLARGGVNGRAKNIFDYFTELFIDPIRDVFQSALFSTGHLYGIIFFPVLFPYYLIEKIVEHTRLVIEWISSF